ncbi:MAG: hypothetical protein ACRDRN_24230 [Sciscionella sp.]
MRRGEVWGYSPQGFTHRRTVVIVSSDGINDSARPWVLGTDVVRTNPQDILSVQLDTSTWVSALYVTRLYRGWFSEKAGALDTAALDQLDVALRAALDL